MTLAWILAKLRERSFGIVLLLIGLAGLLPAVSACAGILLAVPAIQMMLGRDDPVPGGRRPDPGDRRRDRLALPRHQRCGL